MYKRILYKQMKILDNIIDFNNINVRIYGTDIEPLFNANDIITKLL